MKVCACARGGYMDGGLSRSLLGVQLLGVQLSKYLRPLTSKTRMLLQRREALKVTWQKKSAAGSCFGHGTNLLLNEHCIGQRGQARQGSQQNVADLCILQPGEERVLLHTHLTKFLMPHPPNQLFAPRGFGEEHNFEQVTDVVPATCTTKPSSAGSGHMLSCATWATPYSHSTSSPHTPRGELATLLPTLLPPHLSKLCGCCMRTETCVLCNLLTKGGFHKHTD